MKTLNIALLCLVCGISAAQLPLKKIRSISAITSVGDKAFFAGGTDFDSGEELWVSDGTPEGTVMVKDINPGYVPSAPSQMISFKGKLFFSAYTAQFGQELWTSDGTAAGTVMVKDLSTNDGGSDPRYLTVFKDHLYFRTSQGGFYKSDGTAAGTILLEQNAYYIVNGIKDGGNYLYYTTNNPNEFKRTDGTIVNTITVPEPEDENVNFHSFHVAGGQLFVFMASQSQHIVELYVYDENTTSWKLLKAVHAPMYGDHEIDNFTAVGTRLFFSLRADYGYDNYTDQLWVSDGTVSGTLQLKSSRWSTGWSYSTMDHFIAYKDALYFRSGISETNALWKSDGTPTGTVKIHDVQIMRPINSSLNPPVISNDLLWFCGASGYASDAELWYSDGTTEGTKLYADLNPKESATPNLLSNANDKVVYFAVGYSYIGTTLWSTSPASELNVLSSYSASIPSGESLYLNNPQGTSCIKISVVLHNSGHRELALSDVVVTGSEFYLKGELPEFLKPGEKLTIDVYFKPFSSGKKTGELIIHSNDQDEPRYLIKLVGEMSAANVRQICTEFDDDMVKTLNALSPAKTITLSKTVVEEKLPALTPVGSLSLPGFTGPVTYTFVNGNGDTNNNHFVIQGNQLLAGKVFDYDAKPIYTVRIKATTAASSTEETFVISIIDKPASLVAADCQPVAQSMNYNLTDTEFNSAGQLFAITNNGRILRSSNEGVNWEFLTTGNWGRLTADLFQREYRIHYRGLCHAKIR